MLLSSNLDLLDSKEIAHHLFPLQPHLKATELQLVVANLIERLHTEYVRFVPELIVVCEAEVKALARSVREHLASRIFLHGFMSRYDPKTTTQHMTNTIVQNIHWFRSAFAFILSTMAAELYHTKVVDAVVVDDIDWVSSETVINIAIVEILDSVLSAIQDRVRSIFPSLLRTVCSIVPWRTTPELFESLQRAFRSTDSYSIGSKFYLGLDLNPNAPMAIALSDDQLVRRLCNLSFNFWSLIRSL